MKEIRIITITKFRRDFNAVIVMDWLKDYRHVDVRHGRKAVFELHPPGTGERLTELSQTLGEMCNAEAGAVFQLLESGSWAQVDDDPNA